MAIGASAGHGLSMDWILLFSAGSGFILLPIRPDSGRSRIRTFLYGHSRTRPV